MQRESLDHVPFWGGRDLERKLREFRDYYNHRRVHASLKGVTPICSKESQPDRSR
ncbi:integrase core domain-containing protein [Steroidobacter agaridevorans]|uniref:integrase core domain-containing protein n=1 Tax=Steroidobacter agaridevorans TaxID=2695856 RepID=UPI0013794E03